VTAAAVVLADVFRRLRVAAEQPVEQRGFADADSRRIRL
jgi:hypothetical protein